jgi:hypothetical protein
VAGPIVLRVENRDPAAASGKSYNIEIRRILPPPPPPSTAEQQRARQAPDALENNWNVQTAAPIGVGAVYDLNFVCPEPIRADGSNPCGGGDHDYLRLSVKAGMKYLMCTFDLGPGVDTVIDLFWGDPEHPLTGNDDERPDYSFLSVMRWVAPSDGEVIIRIGPRTGGLDPIVLEEQASSYRFAVALADSPLAAQLTERIDEQTGRPKSEAPPRAVASGTGESTSGSPGQRAPQLTAQATPSPTSPPTATPFDTGEPQPIVGAQVIPLEDVLTPTPTEIPRSVVPIVVRTGYDRNQNQVLDPDEGIRGLMVYVTDGRGQLIGQAMTDSSGVVQLTVQAVAQYQLTVSIPYFAAASVVSAQQPRLEPILISQVAAVPGLLP